MASDDISGGPGFTGLAQLQQFVESGGVLLTLGKGTSHPIAYGYGAETNVFRTQLPVYETPRRWITMAYCTSCLTGPVDERHVVLTWGGQGDMVVSGGMRGEAELKGHPAILDIPAGKGHVIACNFNGIHRDMNRGDFRLVWNALINWNALPNAAP